MAYDEALAERVRRLVAAEPGVTERKMFGGLAFLVNGNLAVSASGRGGLMLRVDPAESAELLAGSHARLVEMRGRTMPGWFRVDDADIEGDDALEDWVRRGVGFARSLPAKR